MLSSNAFEADESRSLGRGASRAVAGCSENTLPNFAACLDVGLGFEFDVRRSRDGVLVCLHDDTLDRTTDGHGSVWPATARQAAKARCRASGSARSFVARIPTIDAVLKLISDHPAAAGSVYRRFESGRSRSRNRRGSHGSATWRSATDYIFIGRAIDRRRSAVGYERQRRGCHIAALASDRTNLPNALEDSDSDWVYCRFPCRRGKKLLRFGPTESERSWLDQPWPAWTVTTGHWLEKRESKPS